MRRLKRDYLSRLEWVRLREAITEFSDAIKQLTIKETVDLLLRENVSCSEFLLNGLMADMHIWNKNRPPIVGWFSFASFCKVILF